MAKSFYEKHKGFFDMFDGILLGNTVLEKGLVLAPVIVASYNLQNSLILGLSFVMITVFSVIISSFISKKIPYTIRVILYALIACLVFIPTAMYMDFLFPTSIYKVGVFLPLIVANSLILVKSESRFHKREKGHMILDIICSAIGFLIVIILVGVIREFLGSATFYGKPIDNPYKARAILLPFSGFIIVGLLAAFVKRIRYMLLYPKNDKKED